MEPNEYWHVVVEAKHAPPGSEIVVVDQTREWIEARILEPRRRGQPITIQGRELSWSDIERIRISMSSVPAVEIVAQIKAEDEMSSVAMIGGPSYKWQAASRAPDKTDELIDSPVGSEASTGPTAVAPVSTADPRKVMVVHGRDGVARRAMFDFLRALGLSPLEWGDLVAATGSGAPYIGQVLQKAFTIATAVVVLFTPDDEAYLREDYQDADDPPEESELTPQARPNVLFEAGMALGVHPDRTILVELGKLRSFSDIYGRHVVRIDHSEGPLREIAKRLKTAGCAVDESGSDWAATVFPRRDFSGGGKKPSTASSSLAGQLDIKLTVSEGEPLARIDRREQTFATFVGELRRSLLSSLPGEGGTVHDALGQIKVLRDHRRPETYREEVEEHLRELEEVLPDVLTERAVLHDIGRLTFVVTNEKEHSWKDLRVELSFAKGPALFTFRHEREQDEHQLPEPPRAYGTGPDPYDVSSLLSPITLPEIEPAWTPSASTEDDKIRVSFGDVDVRAEGKAFLPNIWLIVDENAPSVISIDWEATADNATKRLKGTIDVAVSDEYIAPAQLLETPPNLIED